MGMNGVTKSIAKQLFYLGVPKTYRIPFRVMASSWDGVSDKTKLQINRKTDKIAHRIVSKKGKSTPGIKTKFIFMMMRKFQKGNTYAPLDTAYWADKGWFGKKRPWRMKWGRFFWKGNRDYDQNHENTIGRSVTSVLPAGMRSTPVHTLGSEHNTK